MGEPATTAKVILHTEKGPLEIELWAKECPVNARNFLTNCANGHLDGLLFYTVVRNYIIQTGDHYTGDGSTNKAVLSRGKADEDALLKDEFNQRLRFNKRGLLGVANVGRRNTNGDQFFITLRPAPELNDRNTLLGKVMGDSVFNAVRIADAELEEGSPDKPLYPTRIHRTEIVVPYFDDLEVFKKNADKEEPVKKKQKAEKKKKQKKVKLSFDDDDDDENAEWEDTKKRNAGAKKIRIRSAHETLQDRSLSSRKMRAKDLVAREDAQKEAQKAKAEEAATQATPPPLSADKTSATRNAELEQEISMLRASLGTGRAAEEDIDNRKHRQSPGSSTSLVEKQRSEYLRSQRFNKNRQLREIQTLDIFDQFERRLAGVPPERGDAGNNAARADSQAPKHDSVKDRDRGEQEVEEAEHEEDGDSDDDALGFMNHRLELPAGNAGEDDGLQTIG